MGSEVVRVTIFGTDFNLRCDGADAETTREVAQYVNSKIAELKELTASRDDMKLAVLSALNIAGELFETKAKYDAEARRTLECEDKIRSYEEKIKSITEKIGGMKKVAVGD
ncbi:MAG: cell division protein ZapA [Chitinispirillales bacterium]|jgi:cell division protein ZapA|nr:cell division protein ZapA [Chitinispirillales bacterium]